jgi:Na+/pantothenate symporter
MMFKIMSKFYILMMLSLIASLTRLDVAMSVELVSLEGKEKLFVWIHLFAVLVANEDLFHVFVSQYVALKPYVHVSCDMKFIWKMLRRACSKSNVLVRKPYQVICTNGLTKRGIFKQQQI